MMRGMFAAISGLRVHQTMLDVTANDIANVNTIGYKAERTSFKDALSQMQRGWLRFAPLTLSGLIAIGALVGVLTHYGNELHLDPTKLGAVHQAITWARESSLAEVVPLVAGLLSVPVPGTRSTRRALPPPRSRRSTSRRAPSR